MTKKREMRRQLNDAVIELALLREEHSHCPPPKVPRDRTAAAAKGVATRRANREKR